MRKLPIYFLIDISESMVGPQIEEVQNGLRTIIQELRVDPYSLETAFIGIMAFAGKAAVLTPLTELYKFYPPTIPIGGGTSLGAGLELLMDSIDREVKPTTVEEKGDWKPIVFLFTDGNPTDNYRDAVKRWNDRYRRRCNLVAVSLGDPASTLTLAQLTENVLILKDTDAESFKQFFKWVTASIKTSSMSVSEQGEDTIKLAPTEGINLEKADTRGATPPAMVDDNFVVLRSRCQHTRQDFLIKYGGSGVNMRRREVAASENPGRPFMLMGAWPIDGKAYDELSLSSGATVNTSKIVGVPTCPCCGNQIGAILCECGRLFCASAEGRNKCPWCGLEGTIGGGASADISRGIG